MKRQKHVDGLIALITDFGTKDGFVGTMKAVILRINPQAKVLDLTHEISPQDLDGAAYVLWSSYSFFPDRTIFVTVVDPGVGTSRKILCARGRKHIFLAPDNGVLKYLVTDGMVDRMWEVTNQDYFSSHQSSTFHGRDIFAPIAAHLSMGLNPKNLGKPIKVPKLGREFIYLNELSGANLSGRVIYTDRFGNLITNFRFRKTKAVRTRKLRVKISNHVISVLAKSYAEGDRKHPVALINSSNLIEIGLKNGNASRSLGVGVGEKVLIEFSEKN